MDEKQLIIDTLRQLEVPAEEPAPAAVATPAAAEGPPPAPPAAGGAAAEAPPAPTPTQENAGFSPGL